MWKLTLPSNSPMWFRWLIEFDVVDPTSFILMFWSDIAFSDSFVWEGYDKCLSSCRCVCHGVVIAASFVAARTRCLIIIKERITFSQCLSNIDDMLMRQKKKKGYKPQSFESKSSPKSLGLRLQVEKDNFSLSLSLVFPSGIIIGAIVIKTAFT